MKKYSKLLVLFLGVLILSGCGGSNEGEVITECTRKATLEEGITLDAVYTVKSKDGIVSTVESKEIVKGVKSYLEAVKANAERMYKPYDDLKYYDYKCEINGDTFTCTVKIDYSKVDTVKMKLIDSANSKLIEFDGKVHEDKIIALYEQLGNTCVTK